MLQVMEKEEEQGLWGFKALKQMMKLLFAMRQYQEFSACYTQLLGECGRPVWRTTVPSSDDAFHATAVGDSPPGTRRRRVVVLQGIGTASSLFCPEHALHEFGARGSSIMQLFSFCHLDCSKGSGRAHIIFISSDRRMEHCTPFPEPSRSVPRHRTRLGWLREDNMQRHPHESFRH